MSGGRDTPTLAAQDMDRLKLHIAKRFNLCNVQLQDFLLWTGEYCFAGIFCVAKDHEVQVTVTVDLPTAYRWIGKLTFEDVMTW